MDYLISYFLENYIELIGAAFGVAYVILATKQSIWCWIVGIINVVMYIFVFLNSKLYGDSVLQIFYLFMSIYGWINWKKISESSHNELTVSKSSTKLLLILLTISIISTSVFGFILTHTPSNVPYWDGLITAVGLVATWMTAKKLIENWLVWVFYNFVSVGIYLYKGLYPTTILYFIMAILAIAGYLEWNKNLKQLQHA